MIFIDADIRKSVLVSRYQLEGEVNGLSQYLSGQKNREDIIYETNYEGFSVILPDHIHQTRQSFWKKICSMI